MTGELPPQGLLTATGFAAREALAVLRKHNISAAPLLHRAGLSEHGLMRADEGNGFPQSVSAIGQCKFLEYAAEAMDDNAFGSTSQGASIRATRECISMRLRQLAISVKRLHSFRAIAGLRTRRFA